MNASIHLLEAVLPTSVTVRAKIPHSHASAQILGTERVGSGTIIETDGIILTVNYVVLGAEELRVTLVDGSEFLGETVARDFLSGLAALRIPGGGYPAAQAYSSAELQLGQEVFTLASAGDDNRRVNSGVISSLAPFDAYWEYHLDRSIRTTGMNPGLGGGALFTAVGRLVGIAALDMAEIGRFTLAVPVEYFLDHRDELLRNGRRVSRAPRAWVGLFCHEVQDHVVIAGVLPGSPGHRCGLQSGDIVLDVAGKPVHARSKLYRYLWSRRPGESVVFRVVREQSVQEISVLTVDAEEFFA